MFFDQAQSTIAHLSKFQVGICIKLRCSYSDIVITSIENRVGKNWSCEIRIEAFRNLPRANSSLFGDLGQRLRNRKPKTEWALDRALLPRPENDAQSGKCRSIAARLWFDSWQKRSMRPREFNAALEQCRSARADQVALGHAALDPRVAPRRYVKREYSQRVKCEPSRAGTFTGLAPTSLASCRGDPRRFSPRAIKTCVSAC